MIDPNEAPEGYVAVAATEGCDGCDFGDADHGCHKPWETTSCAPAKRMDRQEVIFIKREEAPQPIGLSSPYAIGIAIENLHRLRDEFAKAALLALGGSPSQKAENAYAAADAMLAAKFSTMTWGKK